MTTEKDNVSALENAFRQFDEAARVLNLTPNQVAVIKQPRRVTEVMLPVRMDDGRIEIFTAYRVEHSMARGPAKGGLRYHPDATARSMVTGRTSLIGFVLRQRPEQAFADHFLPQVLSGLSQAAAAQGYHVLIKPIPPEDDPNTYTLLIRERQVDGIADARVAGPRQGQRQVGFGLFAGLAGHISASAGEVAVAALPEGPTGDVFPGELPDKPRCLGLIEQVLHKRCLLYGGDGDAIGKPIG